MIPYASDEHPGVKPSGDDDAQDGMYGVGSAKPPSPLGEAGSSSCKAASPPVDADPISIADPEGNCYSEMVEIEDITGEEYEDLDVDDIAPAPADVSKGKEVEVTPGVKEGEFVHDYTREELEKMFEVSLPESSTVADIDFPSRFDDDTEVVFEDTEASGSKVELVDFSLLFKVLDADLVYISERITTRGSSRSEADILEDVNVFNQRMDDFKKFTESSNSPSPPEQPKQISKFCIASRSKMKGKIISWGYFHYIPGKLKGKGCYVVKHTDGIQYFGKAFDPRTLPYYDFQQLARLKMLKPIQDSHNAVFERMLRTEFKKG